MRKPIDHIAILAAGLLAFCAACGDDSSTPGDGTDGSDTRAPETIDDLGLAYDAGADAVVFTWTARRDDIVRARPDHYDIRYGQSFPFDWEQSTRVTDPPAPLEPGAEQLLVLPNPPRGRDLYASMRAIDGAGNESLAGGVAHVRVPGFSFEAVCTDPLAGAPVAGLDAIVTTRSADHFITGADGRIALSDLAGGTLGILLTRGSAAAAYHTFNDSFTLDDDASRMIAMIPFQKPVSPLYPSMLNLLRNAIFTPGTERTIKKWPSYPVQWYAPDFVSSLGVDYRAAAVRAAQRWNTRLGYAMFAPVASDPTVGVLLEFLPRSTMGTVNGITQYTSTAAGYPLHDRIRIVDDITDEEKLYLILVHELGHTIRLGHLPAGFIMYASQPLPPDISDDEVALVQLFLSLPNGTDLLKYDDAPPAP